MTLAGELDLLAGRLPVLVLHHLGAHSPGPVGRPAGDVDVLDPALARGVLHGRDDVDGRVG